MLDHAASVAPVIDPDQFLFAARRELSFRAIATKEEAHYVARDLPGQYFSVRPADHHAPGPWHGTDGARCYGAYSPADRGQPRPDPGRRRGLYFARRGPLA